MTAYGTTRLIDLTSEEAAELAADLRKKVGSGTVFITRQMAAYDHDPAVQSTASVWFSAYDEIAYFCAANTVADALVALEKLAKKGKTGVIERARRLLEGTGYEVVEAG
mgnify:FL=1